MVDFDINIFMTTFLVFVYKKIILLFDQLETDNSENIGSFLGGL